MSIIYFLMFLIIGLFVLLIFIRHKASKSEMQSDQIEIYTQMTVQEIIEALRSIKCQIEKLQGDALDDVDNSQKPEIAVLLSGKVTLSDTFKHAGTGRCKWGVQVMAYDLGNKRLIQLIAIGEKSGLRQAVYANGDMSVGLDYYHIKQSIDYRNQIAQMFQ